MDRMGNRIVDRILIEWKLSGVALTNICPSEGAFSSCQGQTATLAPTSLPSWHHVLLSLTAKCLFPNMAEEVPCQFHSHCLCKHSHVWHSPCAKHNLHGKLRFLNYSAFRLSVVWSYPCACSICLFRYCC